jgi:hypothetical protein
VRLRVADCGGDLFLSFRWGLYIFFAGVRGVPDRIRILRRPMRTLDRICHGDLSIFS